MRIALSLSAILLTSLLYAESVDDALEGFDDTPATTSIASTEIRSDNVMEGFDDNVAAHASTETANDPKMEGFDDSKTELSVDSNTSETIPEETEKGYFSGFSGKFTQQAALSYNKRRPQNVFYSLRQSFFLNYDKTFGNGLKFKINARAFYDGIYDTSSAVYYPAEVASLNHEVELFEAYLEWSPYENIDVKLGRQVVVWGRSDTIRITDILNPIDNRRPGIVDIEDLYLPVTMLKFDYQYDNWRISPIIMLEQRFTKDPPYGSLYNPFSYEYDYDEAVALGLPIYSLSHEQYNDPTYALSIGADFEGWDINFYASRLYEDRGYIPLAQLPDSVLDKKYSHNKTNMFGTALNVLSGSWLFKTELAYFSGLTYTATQDRRLSRTDGMLGLEYSGITNTTISYDFSVRHFNQYDSRLFVPEENFLEQNTYQQAFRISSNFVDDTIHPNYVISMYGKQLDEGGYQRAWLDYDVADAINAEFGVVDYFGGTPLFDLVKDQVVVFMDMSYNF